MMKMVIQMIGAQIKLVGVFSVVFFNLYVFKGLKCPLKFSLKCKMAFLETGKVL